MITLLSLYNFMFHLTTQWNVYNYHDQIQIPLLQAKPEIKSFHESFHINIILSSQRDEEWILDVWGGFDSCTLYLMDITKTI